MREIGIANQRADAQRPIGQAFDAIETGQVGDVDQTIGARDIALHQIEQIGTGGEIGGARCGGGLDRGGDGRGSDVIEVFHAERLWLVAARLSLTSSTASVIPA